jgi:hypothetical protein
VALPDSKPGLVIRYDYLWNREAASGRDHGKDRPACLVAASDSNTKPRFVVILPISHSAPAGNTIGIAIPPRVRQALGLQALGLDDEPCWVIVSEHNIDEWPNGGLQPLPGRPGKFSYGFIPPSLFLQIKTKFLELAGRKQNA